MSSVRRTELSPPVSGFVAAPFTPMKPDATVDFDKIDPYAGHLKADGVSGVFVNGTTGEGYSLSRDERLATAERWIAHQDESFSVIVHVGAESVADAQALTRHAAEIGAFAVGTINPVFYKPNLDGIIRWLHTIAEAAGGLPLYYYHIPSMTGAYLSVVELLERAATELPTLRGVKFTHNDLMEYRLCRAVADGRFDVLFGRDEILLSALALGAQGMVGSMYNYAAPLFTRLVAAFSEGELERADRLQEKIMHHTAVLKSCGGLACGKALMSAVGLDLGPCRAPNALPPADLVETAVTRSRELGVIPAASPV